MWPHSSRWDTTIGQSHVLAGYAELLVDGVVAASTADPDSGLRLTAGRVGVAEGAIRRQSSLSLYDGDGILTPVVTAGLIIPRLCEVRLWAGVQYSDASGDELQAGTDTEYVPVFTGPITAYDLADYPHVDLQCSDRMWYVQQPFSSPFTVLAGAGIDDGLRRVLAAKVAPTKLVTSFPVTDVVTALLILDQQTDPADKARDMATAAGWALYCDPMGTFIAADEPTLDPAAVVAEYRSGPGGALIKPKLTGNVTNTVNTWVVEGTAPTDTAATPWGKATDDDPASPTYVRGPWDEQVRFISLPELTSDAACRLAARTYKRREVGVSDAVAVEVFPDPAREKGDVFLVDGGLAEERLLMVDSFDLDLFGSGPQELVARPAVVDVSETG